MKWMIFCLMVSGTHKPLQRYAKYYTIPLMIYPKRNTSQQKGYGTSRNKGNGT